jgi:hypothetical protein
LGSGNDKNLYDYVRAAVEQASTNQQPVQVPTNYGWQPDDSFVFNEHVYSPNLSPRHVPMRGLININKATKPQGSLDNWKRIVQLLAGSEDARHFGNLTGRFWGAPHAIHGV